MHQAGKFDYQSECHCSKTAITVNISTKSLTTSQNATAPKLYEIYRRYRTGLTTSQNATAPKLGVIFVMIVFSLTTSQNATAPKQKYLQIQIFCV